MSVDKRRRIPVKDVRNIAYEIGLWAIDIEKTSHLKKLLGKPADVSFKEKFDKYIDDRIQMVIDRLDYKE